DVQGGHGRRAAVRRDRGEPEGRGLLPAQGDRLGAAPARADRPAVGAGVRRRPPRSLPAVPARGAQTPVIPEMWFARTGDGVAIAYQTLGRGPALVWLPSALNNLQ